MIRYSSWSALFALASMALSVVLWLRIGQFDSPPTAASEQALPMRAAPAHDPASPARLGKLGAYSTIADRPLFSPTRRPVVSAAPQTASQPRKSLAKFVLSGVIIVSPEEKIALLREAKSPTAQRLSEGQKIAGWRIEKILPDRVILVSGDETAEIQLWGERPPPPRRPGIKIPTPATRR